jgi:dihydroorotate dehydrogenase electron transfer subunit
VTAPAVWRARVLGRGRPTGGAREVRLALGPAPAAAAGQFALLSLGDALPAVFGLFRIAPASGWFSVLARPGGRASGRLLALAAGDRVRTIGFLGRGFPDPLPGDGTVHMVAESGRIASYWLLTRQARREGRPAVLWTAGGPAAEAGAAQIRAEGASWRRRDAAGTALAAAVAAARPRDLVCVAGPEAILAEGRRAAARLGLRVLLSVESPMACGVGACLGCPVRAADAPEDHPYLRVCADGPVFEATAVVL